MALMGCLRRSSVLALALAAGCTFQISASTPDADDADAPADTFVHDVPPRLIEGGGIGDAPVGSVVNVYVIDWITRAPIADAAVDVGTISGMTDATGLFVARSAALQGKQTVFATHAGYRAELWIGTAGANVTIPLKSQPQANTPPHADLSGTFANFGTGLPVPAQNHVRGGAVSYSQQEGLADPWNNLKTAAG